MRRFARWMLNAVTVLCLLALLEALSNTVSSGWYGAGADVMLWRLSPDVPARSLFEPPPRLRGGCAHVHVGLSRDADGNVGVPDGARGGALAQLRERAFEDLGRRKWIGGEVLNADKGKIT